MTTLAASSTSTQTIVSHTIPWAGPAPLEFSRTFKGQPRGYWRDPTVPVAIAGAGVVAVLQAAGSDRFRSIRAQATELFARIEASGEIPAGQAKPRLFGGFAFRPDFEPGGIWEGFFSALFILPHYQLIATDGHRHLTVNRAVGPDEAIEEAADLAAQDARALQRATVTAQSDTPQANGELEVSYPLDFSAWDSMVSQAVQHIRKGDLQKVVLSRASQVRAAVDIDPLEALGGLIEAYPNCYPFLFEPEAGRAFFGATPEVLTTVNGGQLTTVALAGSARRGATPEEDRAEGQGLLDNPKERQEHALVVAALREQLGGLTTDLQIGAEPELHKLANIQHLRTPVQGRLKAGLDVLDVVESLHPTPALGGAPRNAALALINELESTPRGWYASPVGWLGDGGNGAFAVAIRSAICAGREAHLFAGAGIVADSQPRAEWDETALKFNPLLDALGGAAHGH